MYIYCLFCATQRSHIIAQVLEKRGVERAFTPRIVQSLRLSGKNIETVRDLLPGYVFLYHSESLLFSDIVWGIDGVIRRVGRPSEDYELTGGDRAFAEELLERDGQISAMSLIREGDETRLADPLFSHSEGRIVKLDARKHRAKVVFTFNNTECAVWVSVSEIESIHPIL